MRSLIILAAAAALGLGTPAKAGIHTDALGLCLVQKTSAADRVFMLQWVFIAMSANPDVAPFAKVTTAQRESYGKGMGALMSRLLTVDCRAEAVKAIQHDGDKAIEAAFAKLGEVAVGGLMTSPAVQVELGRLMAGVDLPALTKLLIEARAKPKQ